MSEELDIQIADYLQRFATKTHPITGKQIAREFNLPSDLNVRESIHALRVQHGLIQICSDHRGYFWSEDPEDWAECKKHLKKRWLRIKDVSDRYEKALENVEQAEIKFQ